MAKIIVWLIVIFVVLLALRMIGMRNARARRNAAEGAVRKSAGEAMVRCAQCGIFLPRAEAKESGASFICASHG